MEAPATSDAGAIRDEKVKLLRAVESADPANLVRGRTGRAGSPSNTSAVSRGVRCRARSTTESFVAFELFADNWRWAGMPVYIRTGKGPAATRCGRWQLVGHSRWGLRAGDDDLPLRSHEGSARSPLSLRCARPSF